MNSRGCIDIQSDPFRYKELVGRLEGLRSARFGDYRLLFGVDSRENVVVLIGVEPRETV